GTTWDMAVINDTIMLGDTEIWTWVNHSNMAHPMTVHGGSFYVLDRNGDLPPEWERGPKSVVHVDVDDTVRTIMKFATYTTGDWPLMYHCHNLMHIEEKMWQFVIVDPSTDVVEQASTEEVRVFPVPASSMVTYHAPFPVRRVRVIDPSGREVINASGSMTTDGSIDMASLVPGMYIAWLEGPGGPARVRVVRE
ncbi:MAG TPA: multicopper oxidase domain-containing protein, partial [Flavobacteriales bacterium]|nr:multicopper oxidase domain-containing protein [Flavobacteriales bacterium]